MKRGEKSFSFSFFHGVFFWLQTFFQIDHTATNPQLLLSLPPSLHLERREVYNNIFVALLSTRRVYNKGDLGHTSWGNNIRYVSKAPPPNNTTHKKDLLTFNYPTGGQQMVLREGYSNDALGVLFLWL
jgi:hypothetical protein